MNPDEPRRTDPWDRFFAPLSDNKLCWSFFDFLPQPGNRSVDSSAVEQVLEQRRQIRYRNDMLRLRLHTGLKAFQQWLFSAEHRMQGRLYLLTHAHARPVVIAPRRRKGRH